VWLTRDPCVVVAELISRLAKRGVKANEQRRLLVLRDGSETIAPAALVLRRRKAGLLTFHRLDVPSTLNITFLSTNLIENVLRYWREATGNIKR
jgi:hypothetical protein